MKEFQLIDELFEISSRFQNKRVVLYKLSEDTKKALNILAYFGISCYAILDTSEKWNNNDSFYLGVRIISSLSKKLASDTSLLIVDAFGKNLKDLSSLSVKTDVLFSPRFKEIIIYGLGCTGKKAISFFSFFKIKVLYAIDRKAINNSKLIINGVKVFSTSYLEEKSTRNTPVVIAIEDNSEALSVADYIKKQGISFVFFFNKYIKLDIFSPFIYIPRGNDLSRIFTPACLRYIHHILDKDIYLLSNDIVFLKNVVKTLRCLGIFLNKAISTTIEANIYEDDFMIFNANELINHNHNYIIWSLPDDYDLGKSFLKISGLPTECFLYSTNAPCRLDRTYVLDTNLGFADERLYIKLDNQVNSETPVSVAILGDSTSDYDLLYEKTWVEFLMNIATENNIHLRCIVAATSGNTSAQEIIRLTRDLIWEKPDIVISYGRVTEIPLTIDQHEFTHFYQDQIFSTLQNSQNGISFFGTSASKSISRGRVNNSSFAVKY